jgi:hypothetical protein
MIMDEGGFYIIKAYWKITPLYVGKRIIIE